MGANTMTELQLNIIGVLTIYTFIFAVLAIVVRIAIYFAKKHDKKT